MDAWSILNFEMKKSLTTTGFELRQHLSMIHLSLKQTTKPVLVMMINVYFKYIYSDSLPSLV